MIISKSQVENILKTYNKQLGGPKVDKTDVAKQMPKKDGLIISGESKIKQKIMHQIKNTDDIRLDKINDLKERISAGTYTVSDDEVAEKMIVRAIVDRFV